MQSGDARS